MTKVLEFLKKTWQEFWKLIAEDCFIYSYPFAVLATISLCTLNVFVAIAWVIWVIACIRKVLEKK